MAAIALIETNVKPADLSPHERVLAEGRIQSRLQQMIGIANGLAEKGIRRALVLEDPESPSAQLSQELNRTGVMHAVETCANDMEILDRTSMLGSTAVGIVPMQYTGAEKTIPVHPSDRNVFEAISARRLLGLATVELPDGLLMGLVQGPRKI